MQSFILELWEHLNLINSRLWLGVSWSAKRDWLCGGVGGAVVVISPAVLMLMEFWIWEISIVSHIQMAGVPTVTRMRAGEELVSMNVHEYIDAKWRSRVRRTERL